MDSIERSGIFEQRDKGTVATRSSSIIAQQLASALPSDIFLHLALFFSMYFELSPLTGFPHPSRRFRKGHTPSLPPLQLRTAPWFQRMRTRLERNELVVHALFLTQQLWRSAAGTRVFSPLRLGGG